jgi:large subunit ribosomal protein L31e
MSDTETKEENIVEAEEEEIEEAPTEATTTTPEERTTEAVSTEEEEEPEETAPAAAAEEAPEGEEEIEVVEEKVYTIPLRHVWTVTPRGMRAPRAARDVKAYVARHMKAEDVALSNEINSEVWARGINKPPRKITVRAVKDKEGKVIIYPSKAA